MREVSNNNDYEAKINVINTLYNKSIQQGQRTSLMTQMVKK